MDLIEYVEKSQLKKNLPQIKPGFIVAVHQKIKEGKKERIQVFKGIVIKIKGGYGVNGSFTVRRVASGVGVEKTFLFNSPMIVKIVVLKQAKVRRAKLYYLRGRRGKAANLDLYGDDKEVKHLIREVAGDDDAKEDKKEEIAEENKVEQNEEKAETDKKEKNEVEKK